MQEWIVAEDIKPQTIQTDKKMEDIFSKALDVEKFGCKATLSLLVKCSLYILLHSCLYHSCKLSFIGGEATWGSNKWDGHVLVIIGEVIIFEALV